MAAEIPDGAVDEYRKMRWMRDKWVSEEEYRARKAMYAWSIGRLTGWGRGSIFDMALETLIKIERPYLLEPLTTPRGGKEGG